MLGIVTILCQYCKKKEIPLLVALLETLYEKNNFFAKAIDYFSNFARQNLDNVTCNTINIVNNPTLEQPIQQLNMLPLPIKKYTMLRVRDEIKLNYKITLLLSDTVHLFKICPSTDVIATQSKDKKLTLWNLKTGLLINTLPENDPLLLICFSADGSRMGTAVHYKTSDDRPMSRIKIWDPLLQKLLYVITQKSFVYHIDFIQGAQNNILTVFTQKKHHEQKNRRLTLWSLTLNKEKPKRLGHTSPLPWRGDQLVEINNEKYKVCVHSEDESIVCIKKKNCTALHICKQAIENNTRLETLNKINSKKQ